MHVYHIISFRPTRYVLNRFRWLEVCNRVRNRNKVKNFIYIGSKIQLFQLEIPIFIYNLVCHNSFINSVTFVFCELVLQRDERRQNYHFSTIFISNSQIGILVSYSRSTYVYVNMPFLIVILKETFVHTTYMFDKSF